MKKRFGFLVFLLTSFGLAGEAAPVTTSFQLTSVPGNSLLMSFDLTTPTYISNGAFFNAFQLKDLYFKDPSGARVGVFSVSFGQTVSSNYSYVTLGIALIGTDGILSPYTVTISNGPGTAAYLNVDGVYSSLNPDTSYLGSTRGTLAVATSPEPATWLSGGIPLLGIWALRRRRTASIVTIVS